MAAPMTAAIGEATATGVDAIAVYSAARPAAPHKPANAPQARSPGDGQRLMENEGGADGQEQADDLRKEEHGQKRAPARRQSPAKIRGPVHER